MVCSTYLEELRSRIEDLRSRGNLIGRVLTDAQLNWSPGADKWSAGQIFDHMRIANSYYFGIMEKAVDKGRYGPRQEVRHTWIGSFLIKAAGPSGNVPAPKQMIPARGPFDEKILTQFDADQQKLLNLAVQADDVDLTSSKVTNPIIPLIRMNLADCFEILVAHEERHVGQIELMMRSPDFPK